VEDRLANIRDAYFGGQDASEHSAEAPRWFEIESETKVSLGPGIDSIPIIGQGMALSYVKLQAHSEAKMHAHSEEQIAFVLEGEMEFEIGGQRRLLRPGMGVAIPAWVSHAARTYDTFCNEIDIFQPPRQALVDLLQKAESDSSE
jgi:quercetin dioxygenase-like cupin family protein